MEFSTQLRLILLLAGALTLVAIYLLGKRHGRREVQAAQSQSMIPSEPARPTVHDFGNLPDMDEDELDTPAYLRRQSSETRSASALPTVMVSDAQWEAVSSHAADWEEDQEGDEESHKGYGITAGKPVDDDDAFDAETPPATRLQSSGQSAMLTQAAEQRSASTTKSVHGMRAEPSLDDGGMDSWSRDDIGDPVMGDVTVNETEGHTLQESPAYSEMDKITDVHAIDTTRQATFLARASEQHTSEQLNAGQPNAGQNRGDIPVVNDVQPAGLHEPPTIPVITAESAVSIPAASASAPVLSAQFETSQREPDMGATAKAGATTPEPISSAAPAEKREIKTNKRKIVALRLAMPGRVPGDQLLSLMQREGLQHGRFDIFHRMHEEVSVFSLASMVEPGTFDLGTMRDQQFPGVTFFMLLPGPLDGLVAWDQMLSCAQRMAHFTEGVLQDERGYKLSSMAIDRLREEVLDFQHLLGTVDVVSG